MKPLTITLVEDNLSYRKAIHLAVEREDQLQIISEFSTAEIALRELSRLSVGPDLILLDLCLPGISGLEAIPHFLNYHPKVKIIVLSQSNAESDILRTIVQGASGYLLKTDGIQQICDSINHIAKGGAVLAPEVAQYLIDLVRKRPHHDEQGSSLSTRELCVLNLIAEGFVKKEISEKLSISYSTVDTHVSHIYEKLNVNNAPSAIHLAHRLGLLD